MHNRVREVRQARGMSMSDLARKAGISRYHLYNIEQGRAEPTLTVIRGLCRALGVRFDDLFGNHDEHDTDDCDRMVGVS